MRRHLGMSWAEWRALPWYEQRALREGMTGEFVGQVDEPATEEDEHERLRSMGLTLN